ncbi:mCG15731, isoform CRA_a, partial [Mus musculus]
RPQFPVAWMCFLSGHCHPPKSTDIPHVPGLVSPIQGTKAVDCAALLETDGSSLGRQITASGTPYSLQLRDGHPLSRERMPGNNSWDLQWPKSCLRLATSTNWCS